MNSVSKTHTYSGLVDQNDFGGLTVALQTLRKQLVQHANYLKILLRPSIERICPAQVQCRWFVVNDANCSPQSFTEKAGQ